MKVSVVSIFAALGCLCGALASAEGFAPPQHPRATAPAGRARVPVVSIGPRGLLTLDGRRAGTLDRPARLTASLKGVIRRRRGEGSQVRAVIIKAPSNLHYADVTKVIEAAKKAGATPIKLVSNDEQLRDARRELETSNATPSPADLPAADPSLPAGMRDPSKDPEILKESCIIVSIAPDGNIYVGRRLVPEGELEAAVRSLIGGLPEAERIVYLRAHIDAPYGQVVSVIETIRRAGAKQIGLVAERRRN
jgi:biopolymer transport protein ExbD